MTNPKFVIPRSVFSDVDPNRKVACDVEELRDDFSAILKEALDGETFVVILDLLTLAHSLLEPFDQRGAASDALLQLLLMLNTTHLERAIYTKCDDCPDLSEVFDPRARFVCKRNGNSLYNWQKTRETPKWCPRVFIAKRSAEDKEEI